MSKSKPALSADRCQINVKIQNPKGIPFDICPPKADQPLAETLDLIGNLSFVICHLQFV